MQGDTLIISLEFPNIARAAYRLLQPNAETDFGKSEKEVVVLGMVKVGWEEDI